MLAAGCCTAYLAYPPHGESPQFWVKSAFFATSTSRLLDMLVFIIIRGRINFQYPRDPDQSILPPTNPPVPPKKELSSGD